MTEATYIMTWDEDKDLFQRGINDVLADTSFDNKGTRELIANYKKNGYIEFEEISQEADDAYCDIFDSVKYRIEPTAEMLDVESVAGDEFREMFDDELYLHFDVRITCDS